MAYRAFAGALQRTRSLVTEDTVVYMYAVVPADTRLPAGLRGVDDTAVRLLPAGGIAAVVSELPREQYGDEALNARLDDLEWVGARGLAHERVLDACANAGPIVPLSLFSLHSDEDAVRARLQGDADRLRSLLRRLEGRREWGVKLWRMPAAADRLHRLSPTIAALTQELETAPPGRRYLLEKKRDAARAEELRAGSQRLAHRAYAALREVADDSAADRLPPSQSDAPRALTLSAAFLVADDGFDAFQRRVTEVAHEVREVGFDVEFTGPWPPYHFASPR